MAGFGLAGLLKAGQIVPRLFSTAAPSITLSFVWQWIARTSGSFFWGFLWLNHGIIHPLGSAKQSMSQIDVRPYGCGRYKPYGRTTC